MREAWYARCFIKCPWPAIFPHSPAHALKGQRERLPYHNCSCSEQAGNPTHNHPELTLFSKQSLSIDISRTDRVTWLAVRRCQPKGSLSRSADRISLGYAFDPSPVHDANEVTHSMNPTISAGLDFQSWKDGVGTGGIHLSDLLNGFSSFCPPIF